MGKARTDEEMDRDAVPGMDIDLIRDTEKKKMTKEVSRQGPVVWT